jgi:hypothetical protein
VLVLAGVELMILGFLGAAINASLPGISPSVLLSAGGILAAIGFGSS